MYCNKCGSKNSEDAKYCRTCGNQLNNVYGVTEEQKGNEVELKDNTRRKLKRDNNGTLITLSILAIVAILTCVGIFGFRFYKNNVVLGNVPDKIEEYKEAWGNVNSNVEEENEFNTLISTLDDAVEDSNVKSINRVYSYIDDLIEEVNDRNKKDIEIALTTLNTSIDGAYDGEKKIIEGYKSEVDKLVEEEKYSEATEIINKWEAI